MSSQVPAQELSSLTTYARSMFCCLQHYDLDNSLGICYRRVSLAPAREFEVNANCVNFGVSSGDATEILSCVILVLPVHSGDHVDDGDTRWILVSLPNLRDLLLAQQSSKLRRDVVCGGGCHGSGPVLLFKGTRWANSYHMDETILSFKPA